MSSKMSTPGAESKPGGSKKKDPLAKKKDELYTRCLERFSSDVFNQTDLVGLGVTKDLQELMLLCQGLASANMFQILTLDGTVCYKIRQKDDANKLANLEAKDFLVYSQIESTGIAGMWTKTLKARTNLHQTVLNRSIKNLETAALIKQIKSIKFPGRKIYMLYELNPGEEVTGGPWFSEGELDVDFIELIGGLITEHVKGLSWREGPKPSKAPPKKQLATIDTPFPSLLTFPHSARAISSRGRILVPQPPHYQDYPTASDILDWIDSKAIIQGKDLSLTDLIHLLDMLVFDGRLERMGKRSSNNNNNNTSDASSDEDDAEVLPDIQDIDSDGELIDNRKKTRTPTARKSKTPLAQDPGDMYRWIHIPSDEDGEERRGPGNGISETPCSRCPVFRLCEEGGPVDARSCGYFGEWLEV